MNDFAVKNLMYVNIINAYKGENLVIILDISQFIYSSTERVNSHVGKKEKAKILFSKNVITANVVGCYQSSVNHLKLYVRKGRNNFIRSNHHLRPCDEVW